MPKNKSKSVPKSESKEVEISKFGGHTIAKVMDKSKFELGHHKIAEERDNEVRRMLNLPLVNSQYTHQKKQFGMKKNLNNMRQNFKHHPLM